MRLVSLVPSATEILFAIGKGPEVIGRSHECDYPPEALTLPAVTSDLLDRDLPPADIDIAVAASTRDEHTIYRLDADDLRALRPDVIFTQSSCAVCAVAGDEVEAALCSLPSPARVVPSDPLRLEDVWDSIVTIGTAAGAARKATTLVAGIRRRLVRLADLLGTRARPRVAVIEWPDPLYAPGHWVPDMVEAAGGLNVFGDAGGQSRPAGLDAVADQRPDLIVLAFCGYDLLHTQARLRDLARHPGWKRIARSARVVAVDGSAYFSRPGPRLADGVELLAWAMHGAHPGLQPPPGRGAELIEVGWVDLAALPARTRETA